MNGGNWRGIGGNGNEGINKAAISSIMNGGPSGIEMDLAGIIVEMEQKLERTINSRLDVLQSQMAQFDRKLYFIEMKLDTLNGLFGTEMPTNEFGRAAGRANRARGNGGNRNNQQMQIFGGGRQGGGGGGEGASAFEEDLMGDEGLMSEDFLPPALRFLFNQFSPQSEEMGSSSNAIRSTSQRTMTAFYGNGNVGRNGGGQQRRFTAAAASSANFSAQMAASIGFTNGPAAFNGNAENGVGKQHLHRGNGMERKMSNGGGGGGNRNQQQLDGGFGQGRRGNFGARNNANGQQWWAMAETNAKKGNNAAANRAATKQKQTLGTGANRVPIWTTRSMMGSYTVSEESEEEEEEKEEKKKEGEKGEIGKGEEGKKGGNGGEKKQQMNGVDKEWGKQIGGEVGKSGRRKSF